MNLNRAISGFLLSLVFMGFFMYGVSGASLFLPSPALETASISDAVSQIVQPVSEQEIAYVQIPNPIINSESAISIDSNLAGTSKVLFEKNSNEKLAIASLTKLMTAVVILDNPAVYNFSKNITVDAEADSQDPLKQDVKLGDTLPIESFFDIMLIESSNKSAYALAEVLGEQNFVGLMNKKAKEIGLENTFFADPTGLSPQNVSTAKDLVKLAEYILKNYPKISVITSVKDFNVPQFGNIKNSDELLGQVPEIVCSKTGFTTQAKGCLLLVTNNSKNNSFIINIILGADNRFLEMKKLLDWQNQICN